MKFLFTLVFIFFTFFSFGQKLGDIDNTLNTAYSKLTDWGDSARKHSDASQDSLVNAQNYFHNLLFNYTSTNVKTISYNFPKLKSSGVEIVNSEDGNLRIYSWDLKEAGTMRYFDNICQYKIANEVYSTTLTGVGDSIHFIPELLYQRIYQIVYNKNVLYIVQSESIMGSQNFIINIDLFSIKGNKLEPEKRFVIDKRYSSKLNYEADLTIPSNFKSDSLDYLPKFDKKSKMLLIPKINNDGQFSKDKIKYRFANGYFEPITIIKSENGN